MRCNPSRWLWGLIPIVMLSWGTFHREQPNVEADLAGRAHEALAAAGQVWARVSLNGRDAVITGRARKDGEPKVALDAVRSVWGIRMVQLKTDLAVAAAPSLGVGPKAAHDEKPVDEKKAQDLEAAQVLKAKQEAETVRARTAQKEAEAVAEAKTESEAVAAAKAKQDAEAAAEIKAKEELEAATAAKAKQVAEAAATAELKAKQDAEAAAAAKDQQDAEAADLKAKQATEAAAAARAQYEAEMAVAQKAKADAEAAAALRAKEEAEAVAAAHKAKQEAEDTAASKAKYEAEMAVAQKAKQAAEAAAALRSKQDAEAAAAQRAKQKADAEAEAKADAARIAQSAKEAEEEARKTNAVSDRCERSLADAAGQGVILFSRASADIDPKSSMTIARLSEIVKSCPGTRIEVGGHTDAEGEPDRNQKLSERRARAVVRSLVRAGVAEDRLTAVGFGDTRPVATNDTALGMAKNRRIEFKVFSN